MNSELLRQAILFDREEEIFHASNDQVDSVILVGEGSILGRTFGQYRDLLGHAGAPDIVKNIYLAPLVRELFWTLAAEPA